MFSIMLFMFCGFCGILCLGGYIIWQQKLQISKLHAAQAEIFLILNTISNQLGAESAKTSSSEDALTEKMQDLLNMHFKFETPKPKQAIDPDLDMHLDLPKL